MLRTDLAYSNRHTSGGGVYPDTPSPSREDCSECRALQRDMTRLINFNGTIGGVYLNTLGGGNYSPTVGCLEEEPPALASVMGGV